MKTREYLYVILGILTGAAIMASSMVFPHLVNRNLIFYTGYGVVFGCMAGIFYKYVFSRGKQAYKQLAVIFLAGIALHAGSFITTNESAAKILSLTGTIFCVQAFSTYIKHKKYIAKPPVQREIEIKQQQINMNDERKIMLREKSGRMSYILMFPVLIGVILIFTYAGVSPWIIGALWLVILIQYLLGVIVFYYLAKRL